MSQGTEISEFTISQLCETLHRHDSTLRGSRFTLVKLRLSPRHREPFMRWLSTDPNLDPSKDLTYLTFRGCPVVFDLPDSHRSGIVFCYEV
jgi:hypothetical protein